MCSSTLSVLVTIILMTSRAVIAKNTDRSPRKKRVLVSHAVARQCRSHPNWMFFNPREAMTDPTIAELEERIAMIRQNIK
jgi:hypothetical protein